MLRLGHHALPGGGAVSDDGASRLSRPALAVSILVHLGVLVVVGRFAWQRADVELEAPTTEYVWIGALPPPTPPVESATPTPEAVQPPPLPAPAVRSTSPPRPAAATEAPPAAAPPQPTEPAETPSAAPAGPTRLDLDTARREAAAAVVEQHARDGKVLRFSLDDAAPPRPMPAPKKPSIFDKGVASGGGSGVLSPGKARTAAGFKLRSWCNRVTGGGFGFFGIPVCTSLGIRPPSGLFVESIPEYMKTKPECQETRPLAAALGETSEYPTVKCRLVPKGPDD